MKTNDMRHTVSKIISNQKITVKIRLNDECNNGYSDFSIVGDIEKKYNNKWVWQRGGCIHEEILKHFPNFKIFVDLHLSDFRGVPLYAVENGIYFIKNNQLDYVIELLRISKKELKELSLFVEDKNAFMYILNSLGIVDRWKKEANTAIKMLEEMTGDVYEDTSTKISKITLTEDEKFDIKEKIQSGYFTPKQVQLRKNEAIKVAQEKAKQEFIKEAERKRKAIDDELKIKLYMLEQNISPDIWIYYSHNKTVRFNWCGYGEKITQEEFVDFLNKVDYNQLPENVKFELNK